VCIEDLRKRDRIAVCGIEFKKPISHSQPVVELEFKCPVGFELLENTTGDLICQDSASIHSVSPNSLVSS
jgi:hypothetical protein